MRLWSLELLLLIACAAPAWAEDAGLISTGPSTARGTGSEGPSSADAGVSLTAAPITATKRWSVKLEGLGWASPRTVDLNGDGVLDVVVAGGVQGQRGWVYAIDGASGATLWKTRFKEELYATPSLSDANRDGVPDLFLGGRDFDWTALSGKDGKRLWTLRAANPKADIPRRNFNGSLVAPDQDQDGVDDLVVSQGGSYDDDHRLPGRVLVVSGATGKLLLNTKFDDQRETYSLPALVSGYPLTVIQGSGGESLGGHLYRLPLESAPVTPTWALDVPRKGVIASPLITRADGDPAVFAALYDGIMVRLALETGEVRWTNLKKGFEARASPAPGRFGGSGKLDVVATMSQGTYPTYEWKNVVRWYDGATGEVLDEAASGVFSSSSPLVVDFDGDGLDETIGLALSAFTVHEGSVLSTLTIYDGARGKKKRLELKVRGAGPATPAIADLDGDGTLDLILTYHGTLERYALELPGAPKPVIRWGCFRGPTFDGVDPVKAE